MKPPRDGGRILGGEARLKAHANVGFGLQVQMPCNTTCA
jgi:hypothetical protein